MKDLRDHSVEVEAHGEVQELGHEEVHIARAGVGTEKEMIGEGIDMQLQGETI